MKNEEAKRIAIGLRTDFKCESETMVDFCNTIIKALEQEPCDDAISRQAAIDAADRADYTGLAVEDVKNVTDEVVKEIKKLPSAQPKRPKGHWIIDGHHIQCSVCAETMCNTDREGDKIPMNFCPNCGADMRGEQDE